MRRSTCDPLLSLVQSYFNEHLVRTQGASPHTVRAYRDGMRLFFLFLSDFVGRPVSRLCLDDITVKAVLAFLGNTESKRGNSVVTRNCRLAALRSFVEHLLRHDMTRADQYSRILAVPAKKKSLRPAAYLEPEEVRAVIEAVDVHGKAAKRDRALLFFLYNTGARVAEALSVRRRDLRLERPMEVRIWGKGAKERICPLWPETAASLRQLISTIPNDDNTFVFLNAHGNPLTRDGVAYVIEKNVRVASANLSSLRRCKVTPHVFRHSCAVALLQAGVDVTVIRDYLGHASIATTSRYISTNLQMRREVLEVFWKRSGLDKAPQTRWRPSPKLLDFLTSL